MNEYIKKFEAVNKLIALENELQQYKPFTPCEATMYRRICETEIEIGKMQAADVAPVRHGRWIILGQRTYGTGRCPTHYCSVCGGHGFDDYPGCPWCFAKMNLEAE